MEPRLQQGVTLAEYGRNAVTLLTSSLTIKFILYQEY